MSESQPTGEELLGISRAHGLIGHLMYVMWTFPEAGRVEAVLENLSPHLAYWADMEQRRVLFAAGPKMPVNGADHWSGEGMVIFSAASMEQARAIADGDPMHESGARKYELSPWLLNHLVTEAVPNRE